MAPIYISHWKTEAKTNVVLSDPPICTSRCLMELTPAASSPLPACFPASSRRGGDPDQKKEYKLSTRTWVGDLLQQSSQYLK